MAYSYFILQIYHANRFRMRYRVSHSKPGKAILLWWRYRLWFLLIFWILRVHEKGTFMPNSSVFIFLMLCAIYGSISQNLLNKFWIILTFRGLYRVSHSKVNKVILLWRGYRFWLMLIFWIPCVHEIGTFMPGSSACM